MFHESNRREDGGTGSEQRLETAVCDRQLEGVVGSLEDGREAGMARLKKLAEWAERDYPSATPSLMEGLEECFTINRLEVPPSLHRCLAPTNLIESLQSGSYANSSRSSLARGSHGQARDGLSLRATENKFQKMMGNKDI